MILKDWLRMKKASRDACSKIKRPRKETCKKGQNKLGRAILVDDFCFDGLVDSKTPSDYGGPSVLAGYSGRLFCWTLAVLRSSKVDQLTVM